MSQENGQWSVLRDWELVRRLNEIVANVTALRRSCTPVEGLGAIKAVVDSAVSTMERQVAMLNLSFRVPAVEAVAVLWPGVEVAAPSNEQTKAVSDSMEDVLD
jgi:hypothetical protein